jgi:hypothetical protein
MILFPEAVQRSICLIHASDGKEHSSIARYFSRFDQGSLLHGHQHLAGVLVWYSSVGLLGPQLSSFGHPLDLPVVGLAKASRPLPRDGATVPPVLFQQRICEV